MNPSHLKTTHQTLFGVVPKHLYFSPGRVNLIGEHTDYSHGYVLPMAIKQGTYATVSLNTLDRLRIHSMNYAHLGIKDVDYTSLEYGPKEGFLNYLKGMILMLSRQGHRFNLGLDITVHGDLPTSAGLSSSASFELLMGIVLLQEHGLSYKKLDVVHAAKAVENDFLGLQSGIMDQYAIMFANMGQALLLDTGRLTHEEIPFDFEGHVLVMMNTNKPRNLTGTDYNARVKAVYAAYAWLKPLTDAQALCDVSIETFEKQARAYPEAIDWNPGRHVVHEHARTAAAAVALKAQDMETFGRYMNASHDSLRDCFKVSCNELDYLVDAHRAQGALGARMTGAGFGGTMIALYERGCLPQDFDNLAIEYERRFNVSLDTYYASPASGVRRIKEAF